MTAAVIQSIEPVASQGAGNRAPDVAETVHGFGDGLVGTLSRPQGRARQTALVLLNPGLLRRTGPFRLYVQIARRLAAEGFVVLRFDQSGLGDSQLSPRVSAQRKREDIVAAMDLVARETGIDRVVLGGLCSGADDAFNIAPLEPRVAGVVLLDGVSYATRGHRLRHYLPRLFDPARVLRFLRRRLGKAAAGTVAEAGNEDLRDFPSRAEATRRLQSLDERGAQALLLYTGGAAYYHNHRRQARECFGKVMRSPRMTTEYWPECDHTFYARAHREKLLAYLADWMSTRFPD